MNTKTEHAEHTPGPWQYSKKRAGVFKIRKMTLVSVRNICEVNCEANARLIASAPDLKARHELNLEDAEKARKDLEAGDLEGVRAFIDSVEFNALTALNKAEGR